MNFDVDIAIFVVYLIINVGFGLYWGRNNKTIQDYA
jgi:Na+/proline symporter